MKTQLLSVVLLVGLLSCYRETPIEPKAVIKFFEPTKKTIWADGVDTIQIVVELPDNTAPERREVTFKTNKGLFVESEKTEATVKAKLNGSNRMLAVVYLRSSVNVERATISAEIADFKDTTSVQFSRAYPNRLVIRTDKLTVQPTFTSEALLTVEQRRNTGQVSIGTVAGLTVIGSDGKQRGRFRNPQPESDAGGKSQFVFTLGVDSTYIGELRAVATVWDSTLRKPVTETLLFYSVKSR